MEPVTNLKAQWEARLSDYARRKQALETEILDARKSLEATPLAAGGMFSKVKAVVSNVAKTLATNTLRAIGGKVRDAESQIVKRRQSLTQQALATVRERDGEFDALCGALTTWLPADHAFRMNHPN